MKNTFSGSLKLIAIATAVIFTWSQVALAEGVALYETYPDPSAQVAVDPAATVPQTFAPQLPSHTTIDFLLGATSPLSTSESAPLPVDSNRTYDDSGQLRTELTQTGHTVRHVYEGETIQERIDQSAAGDEVFLHAGTYHQNVVLKEGVNLKGESPSTTIMEGGLIQEVSVIRALGNNSIEGLTITGAREGEGEATAAIRIEGDHVKIHGNKIQFNLSSGVYVGTDAERVSITGNLFNANRVAIREPRTGNTIRYNTITGYETEELIKIKGFRYISNKGFQLEIQDPQGAYSYYIEYSDDKGSNWKKSRIQTSPGVFKDQLISANPAGNTFWVDDGSTTTPDPLSVSSRLYRVRLAESFMSQTGMEVLRGEAP